MARFKADQEVMEAVATKATRSGVARVSHRDRWIWAASMGTRTVISRPDGEIISTASVL